MIISQDDMERWRMMSRVYFFFNGQPVGVGNAIMDEVEKYHDSVAPQPNETGWILKMPGVSIREKPPKDED